MRLVGFARCCCCLSHKVEVNKFKLIVGGTRVLLSTDFALFLDEGVSSKNGGLPT